MRVSVLINNYNYARFVCVAIASSLNQSHRDVEVIVVDDGSQDESLKVIRKFEASITLIAKKNGGQASAYNEGFRRSTGEIVIFLDADDWLFPGAVDRVLAAWRPDVSKIHFPLELVDVNGRFLGRRIPRAMSGDGAMALLRKFGTYNSPPGSGNAYDAQFLKKIMPIDEAAWRIAADTVPIVLAPAFGRIISLPASLGAYRLHSGEAGGLLMNNAPADLWDEYRRITTSKVFVSRSLTRLGLESRAPMLFAPWEARIVALCVRFGNRGTNGVSWSRPKLAWFALTSLWQWPDWRLPRKALQAMWMLFIFFSPYRLAIRIALRHKSSAGAPVRSVQ